LILQKKIVSLLCNKLSSHFLGSIFESIGSLGSFFISDVNATLATVIATFQSTRAARMPPTTPKANMSSVTLFDLQ
jgi:hypothetical protein